MSFFKKGLPELVKNYIKEILIFVLIKKTAVKIILIKYFWMKSLNEYNVASPVNRKNIYFILILQVRSYIIFKTLVIC